MKAKTYNTGKELANAVYQRDIRLSLTAEAAAFFRGGFRILVEPGWDDDTYTYMKKPGIGIVHLSLKTACRAAGIDLDRPVPAHLALATAKRLKIRLRGLFYHEIGHLKRSDMTGEAFQAVDPKYQWAMQFIKSGSNVCEDPKMERLVADMPSFHFTKNLFKTLVKDLFMPQAKAYRDDGSIDSFLEYMLLWLRCGPGVLTARNAKFDSLVPKGIYDKMRECHRENDDKERCRKQVAFMIWLIEELGLTQSDMPSSWVAAHRPVIIIVDKTSGEPREATLQPEGSELPPVSIVEAGEEGGEGDGSEQPDADVIDMRKNKPDPSEEEGDEGASESESPSEGDEEPDEPKEGKEGSGKPSDSGQGAGDDGGEFSPSKPEGDFDWEIGEDEPLDVLAEMAMEGAADQNLETALSIDTKADGGQQAYRAKESIEITDESVAQEALEKAKGALGMLPAGLAESLSLLKAQSAPYEKHWLPDGDDIDIDDYLDARASHSLSRDVYVSEEIGLEITDLSVSLLVDVSGSMDGSKSKCAFLTSYMVATACDEADIPYEISVFSTGGVVYLKEFEDRPEDVSSLIPIIASQATGAYAQVDGEFSLWSGTDCESALAILLENLRKKNEKAHKLVFVVTDGETGNPSVTGRLVKEAREEGIVVVGVGIGTYEQQLKVCFERCKAFSLSSIGKLPSYVAQEIELAMESNNFQGY